MTNVRCGDDDELNDHVITQTLAPVRSFHCVFGERSLARQTSDVNREARESIDPFDSLLSGPNPKNSESKKCVSIEAWSRSSVYMRHVHRQVKKTRCRFQFLLFFVFVLFFIESHELEISMRKQRVVELSECIFWCMHADRGG